MNAIENRIIAKKTNEINSIKVCLELKGIVDGIFIFNVIWNKDKKIGQAMINKKGNVIILQDEINVWKDYLVEDSKNFSKKSRLEDEVASLAKEIFNALNH